MSDANQQLFISKKVVNNLPSGYYTDTIYGKKQKRGESHTHFLNSNNHVQPVCLPKHHWQSGTFSLFQVNIEYLSNLHLFDVQKQYPLSAAVFYFISSSQCAEICGFYYICYFNRKLTSFTSLSFISGFSILKNKRRRRKRHSLYRKVNIFFVNAVCTPDFEFQ